MGTSSDDEISKSRLVEISEIEENDRDEKVQHELQQ